MEEKIKETRLESPLVVHKEGDASYQGITPGAEMNATHSDDETADVPTLERHRFRKEKKGRGGIWALLAVIAVAVAVVCALYYSGVIGSDKAETTEPTQKQYVQTTENKFSGIITVKGTYIFFEGSEVDGLKGLEDEIKYIDAGTKFTVQDEDADSNFLNLDVLSLLEDYNIDYDVAHIVSSGLTSKYEAQSSRQSAQTTASSSESSSQ